MIAVPLARPPQRNCVRAHATIRVEDRPDDTIDRHTLGIGDHLGVAGLLERAHQILMQIAHISPPITGLPTPQVVIVRSLTSKSSCGPPNARLSLPLMIRSSVLAPVGSASSEPEIGTTIRDQ